MSANPWEEVEEHFKTCYSKKQYGSPQHVERVQELRERDIGKGVIAPYRCPHCRMWHLTRKVGGQHADLYRKDKFAMMPPTRKKDLTSEANRGTIEV